MRRLALLALACLLVPVGCSDDGPSAAVTTTSTTEAPPGLDGLLLTAADLPAGFEQGDDVDDTITSFCAGEDAAAGLQASDRSVRGFTRRGGGASVIQLVFRFRGDDAATFVRQADGVLTRCDGVPDLTGLAFDYEPVSDAVAAVLAGGGDASTARHGVSAGSANLSIDVVVLHDGDVGQLIAVLGLQLPRSELDALAEAAFTAALAKL